ncbi:hypothetical protein KZZ08_00590 [Roseovarius mucosus]|uniref:hypothetical protein n=1 Tax=Roseovarius mucosus TaxID=215743 RepID=UPI001C5D3F4F|nr:hypothetical protein [Roseovarius mucosus]MBW4972093.1 hypothetical protein [Roseovarius mucosus]
MAKASNQFEIMAREAAERIDAAREAGKQLTFLPDEQPEGEIEGEGKAVGRPKGAKNKVSTQMRDYLAARGYRLPEDVLIEIAGLNTREDVVTLAMTQTERVLIWAHGGKAHAKDHAPGTMAQRLAIFQQQYTMILRAAEALLPYMAPKATPDINVSNQTTVFVAAAPTAPADPAGSAKDITPQGAGSARRTMPADVRHEIEQKQALSNAENQRSDADIRTDEASD